MPSRNRHKMRRERQRLRLQDPTEQMIDLSCWLLKLGVLPKPITLRTKSDALDRFVFERDGRPITRSLPFREARTFLSGLTTGLKLSKKEAQPNA